MSKPAPPAPVSAPVPTRRQLDELEALLQRMLELPVRQEQETTLPPSAPRITPDRFPESFDPTPSQWDETTSEAAIDPALPQFPEAVDPERRSPPDAPLFLVDSLPEVDSARDSADVPVGGRFFSSRAESIREAQEKDQTSEAANSQWPSETLQPEPGIFRILLGWAGLVCLIISLAILLLDWYGWTW